jgi:hypothetical protein
MTAPLDVPGSIKTIAISASHEVAHRITAAQREPAKSRVTCHELLKQLIGLGRRAMRVPARARSNDMRR